MPKPLRERHPLYDIDNWLYTARCEICGPVGIYPSGKDGWICARLREAVDAENRRRSKARRDAKKHELSARQVRAMVAAAGRCAICGAVDRLVVDHDHRTGVVRGVICHRCNIGLGVFLDDAVRLRAAARYLEESSV